MFVNRQAVQLGLKGWVRNLNDGRVEAWVLGGAAELKKLEDLIKSGPPSSRVESLVVTGTKPEACSEFTVKPDGEKPWSEKS